MSTRGSTRSVLVATLSLLACLVAPPASGAGDAVRHLDARQPEIVDLGIPGERSLALRIDDRGVIAGIAGPWARTRTDTPSGGRTGTSPCSPRSGTSRR